MNTGESPTYAFFTTADRTTPNFWLMYAQVGDFPISRGSPTVPLILRNVVFFKSQNPRKAGSLCIESNQSESSGDLIISIGGFLGCIENKAYDWPKDDWPKTDSLADKARKCYLNFQACSGSAMLIPDRKDSPQV